MKYFFLDIDGVISTFAESMNSTKDYWIENDWARKLGVQHGFNSECVNKFNEILLETGAEIILSSDWKRHGRTLLDLDTVFKMNGVIKSPIDFTPDYRDRYSNLEYRRTLEIVEYIAENNINLDDLVILDDLDLDYYFPPRVSGRFVKTDFQEGLKELGIKEKILNLFK